jgi:hypothetical protein
LATLKKFPALFDRETRDERGHQHRNELPPTSSNNIDTNKTKGPEERPSSLVHCEKHILLVFVSVILVFVVEIFEFD